MFDVGFFRLLRQINCHSFGISLKDYIFVIASVNYKIPNTSLNALFLFSHRIAKLQDTLVSE